MALPRLSAVVSNWYRDDAVVAFTHVCSNVYYGVDRTKLVLDTVCKKSKVGGRVPITYFMMTHADVTVASGLPAVRQLVQKAGKLGSEVAFTTLRSWFEGDMELSRNQVLFFDLGGDVRSSDIALGLLQVVQHVISRNKALGFPISVVTMSNRLGGPINKLKEYCTGEAMSYTFRAVDVDVGISTYATSHDISRSGDWLDKAEELVGNGIHDGGSGLTFACVMRYEDSRTLFARLQQSHPEMDIRFHSVQPWSGMADIKLATSTSGRINLVHVDDEVSMLPPMASLKGVLVGPRYNSFLFDTNTYHVVKVVTASPNERRRRALAFSLIQGAKASVHVFKSQDHLADSAIGWLSHPAFDRDISHFHAGVIHAGSATGKHPSCLPVEYPNDDIMVGRTEKCLSTWSLFDKDKLNETFCQTTQPLGANTLRFLADAASNINAMVLLGRIDTRMPTIVRSVLVDMAVLISQGPSEVFSTSTAETKGATLKALKPMRWYAAGQIHRGQLWLSLACLHALDTGQLSDDVKPHLRLDLMSHLLVRASELKKRLSISGDTCAAGTALTMGQVRLVDEQLARAFLFNTALSERSKPFFATDLVSRVVLRRAGDDMVEWDRVWLEHEATGSVAVVYSCLSMTGGDRGGEKTYWPVDMTVVSIAAVAQALREVGGEESLRRRVGPYRRTFVPHDVDMEDEGDNVTPTQVNPSSEVQGTQQGRITYLRLSSDRVGQEHDYEEIGREFIREARF